MSIASSTYLCQFIPSEQAQIEPMALNSTRKQCAVLFLCTDGPHGFVLLFGASLLGP